jgi:hypothetical protein
MSFLQIGMQVSGQGIAVSTGPPLIELDPGDGAILVVEVNSAVAGDERLLFETLSRRHTMVMPSAPFVINTLHPAQEIRISTKNILQIWAIYAMKSTWFQYSKPFCQEHILLALAEMLEHILVKDEVDASADDRQRFAEPGKDEAAWLEIRGNGIFQHAISDIEVEKAAQRMPAESKLETDGLLPINQVLYGGGETLRLGSGIPKHLLAQVFGCDRQVRHRHCLYMGERGDTAKLGDSAPGHKPVGQVSPPGVDAYHPGGETRRPGWPS